MITCGRCQTQNLDGSQFCDECGAALLPGSMTSLGNRGGQEARTGTYRFPLESDEATVVRADKPQPAAMPPRIPEPLAPVPLPPPAPATPPPVYEAPASHRHQATSANSGLGFPPPLAAPAPKPAQDVAVNAKLVIERGRAAGKQFSLSNDEALIGRWDADGGIFPDVDLDADDPEAKVSRRHARIVRQSGQYYVEDLGSTNGTFINRGRRLLPGDRHPLNDGDELIIGKMFMRFYLARN